MTTFDVATLVSDTTASVPPTSDVVPRIAVVLGGGWNLGASFHAGVLLALCDEWGDDARLHTGLKCRKLAWTARAVVIEPPGSDAAFMESNLEAVHRRGDVARRSCQTARDAFARHAHLIDGPLTASGHRSLCGSSETSGIQRVMKEPHL